MSCASFRCLFEVHAALRWLMWYADLEFFRLSWDTYTSLDLA